MWSATQIPHVLRTMLCLCSGLPEHKLRVIAPDVGGGFGGKLQLIPEEILTLLVARKLGQPASGPRPVRSPCVGPPRPRPAPDDHDRRQEGRHVHRAEVRHHRRHGRLLRPVHGGDPGVRRVHRPGHLQVPGLRGCLHRRLHEQDPDRRLPRRRTPGGHLRDRAHRRRARRRARPRPDGAARAELDQERRVPVHQRRRPDLRLGQLRGRHREGLALFDYDGLRREQEQRREANDPVQLGIGISTFTEMCGLAPSRLLGALGAGAGGWEHAAIRMLATGKVEVVTGSSAARAGARDGVEPDRGRPARRAVRRHRGAARRHPGLAEGPGHLRVAVAAGRRHGRGQVRGEGGRQGQDGRGAPAGGVRGRPRVHQRPVRGQGHRQGRDDPGGRAARRSRRTTSPRASSRRWTRSTPSTRRTSRSRTARTWPRSRSTPRPAT